MTLPTFLGIGCKRAGSTLLHRVLQTNPAIYVPTLRKELWFFDVNWHRGPAWYERFFADARPEQRVGEVTPGYIFAPQTDDRVYGLLGPTTRLLAIVRHPAAQAWSWWLLNGAPGRFDDWLDRHVAELSTGSHLHRWQARFDNMHVMVLEEFVTQPEPHLSGLADFLGVPDVWPGAHAIIGSPVNSSVKRSRLGSIARRMAATARQAGFDRVVNVVKRNWREKSAPAPALPDDVRRRVHGMFEADIAMTESVLGRPIVAWQPKLERAA